MLSLFFLASAALGTAAGPDAYGIELLDSLETDGPPFAVIDLSNANLLPITGDELFSLELPFVWEWYDVSVGEVSLSTNGVLFFDGETSSPTPLCPGLSMGWSGIAAYWTDWEQVEVRWAEVGRYPHRAFAVEWAGDHATAGGYGVAQAWLLEGGGWRPETVIVHDDIEFGDPAIDFGAGASVGVHHVLADGTPIGVAWGCQGGVNAGQLDSLNLGRFGRAGYRTGAPQRRSDDLGQPFRGSSNFQYFGEELHFVPELSGGLAGLMVSSVEESKLYLYYGQVDIVGQLDSQAAVTIEGQQGSDFGSSMASGDLDDDGNIEVVVGAPRWSSLAGRLGEIYAFDAMSFRPQMTEADAQWSITGQDHSGRAGWALEIADFNGDGVDDLAIGAPYEDTFSFQVGVVYIWFGHAGFVPGVIADADLIVEGSNEQSWFGRSLSSTDIDGDGSAELFVGAPLADDGGSDFGAVYALNITDLTATGGQSFDASSSC